MSSHSDDDEVAAAREAVAFALSAWGPTDQPHDALFKHAFTRVEHVRGELESVLPADLLATLDLDALRVVPGTFVDETLRGSASDVLLTVPLAGRPAFVYVLFEHQSSVDADMPLRLLGYMHAIWSRFRRENRSRKARLPPIVPIVLHHGPSAWRAPTSLGGLVWEDGMQRSALDRFVPDFHFVVDDLARTTPGQLRFRRALTAFARVVLFLLMRARHSANLGAELAMFREDLRLLGSSRSGLRDLAVAIRYAVSVGRGGAKQLRNVVHWSLGQPTEGVIMTIADELIAEGMEKGLAKGLAQGKAELLLRLLRRRFGSTSEALEARVRTADSATLDRWAERVLFADSMEAVFEAEG